MLAGVAGGHPATVAAGIEILEEGGTAADAAVAAALASCVAETVMTGLLGGGFAIHWDGREAWNLDCFVDVPSGAERDLVELKVPFGEELVHYAIGPGSCAVPGLPAGLDALWRRFGRLPWPRVVEPALRLARTGVVMPPEHAACLAMLAPVFTMQPDGARIYAPQGRPLEGGEVLAQPGLAAALELSRRRARRRSIAARSPRRCWRSKASRSRPADLEAHEPRWLEPVEVSYAGTRFLTRGGLSGVPETLAACRRCGESARRVACRRCSTRSRVRPAAATRRTSSPRTPRTRVRADLQPRARHRRLPARSRRAAEQHARRGRPRSGAARAGRADAEHDGAEPRARPRTGVALAIGAAGGTRLRTALVGVAAGLLDEGLDPVAAVERPRFHRVGDVVNAEPGVDEEALARLERVGLQVRRWPARHHYFGGVSLIARGGAAGDPRRGGRAMMLP